MLDVLLTHSYHLFYDRKQVRKMQPYPPLGTLYAASLLRKHGFSVGLFDAMLEDPTRGFRNALGRQRPRIVAVYEDNFNFLSKMCLTRMRRVAMDMGRAACDSGAIVIVNGSDASDHVAEYLEHGFDYVLIGEGEQTLLELVQSLLANAKQKPANIAGLAFFENVNGKILRTPARNLLRDLDILPFPARDLVNIEQYRDAWVRAHGFFSLNLIASRGCPYGCNWCAKPIFGDSFHIRSAASVAEEIQELGRTFRADHLWFADDIFGLKPSWVMELAEATERLGVSVPFKMQSRINLMTRETVKALRRAGCIEVWMGVESGSQKILNAMDKGIRVEQVAVAREHLRREGIRACFFLQFGYPGETWDDIQKTIQLVRQVRPDDIGISVAYPLPRTKFYERVREGLGAKRNWIDSDDLSMMFHGAYSDEFYRVLHDALHAEVETWSLPSSSRFSLPSERVADDLMGTATLAELWVKVEQLEKTCRYHAPSLSSAPGSAEATLG